MENKYKGKVLEVIECMKDELINQLYMIKFDEKDFDFNGIENIQDNMNLYLECINGIYQDYITDILNKDDEIEIYYNPMGSLYYKKVGDDKDE